MAIIYGVTPRTYCAPGNLIAENYGEHMISANIEAVAEELDGYVDNGTIVKIGKMISLDQWDCELATTIDAYIPLKGVDGRWLVVINSTEDDSTALIYQKPLINEESPRALTLLKNFTNDPVDGPVRAYILHTNDRFWLDENGFDGEPSVGATISSISADGKLVVTAAPSV